MRSRGKTLVIALLVGVTGAVIASYNTPHLSESCAKLHESMKQLALNDSGLAGTIAVVPEEVLDRAVNERYASIPADQCAAYLPGIAAEQEALSHTKWAPQMRGAGEEATKAVLACRDKRVNGELKTHVDSVQCSSPQIIAAFARIGYPYMDLVALFIQKRAEDAEKLDKAIFTQSEDQLEFAKLALAIAEQEGKRVTQH